MTAEPVDTIAAAIAERYTAANMAAPGGLPPVRGSTADLPNAMGALPRVLVFVDSGTLQAGNGTRLGNHRFLVRFYLARRRDLPRESARIRTWLPTLLGQHQAGVQLGGLVAHVYLERYQAGVLPYAGIDYAGVELAVVAVTSIPWPVTA